MSFDFPRLNTPAKITAAILAGLLSIGGLGYTALRLHEGGGKKLQTAQISTQGGMDPGYFAASKFKQTEPEPKPEEPQSREIPPPPPAPPSAPPVPTAPPKQLSQQQIFRGVYPPAASLVDQAQEINRQRRGNTAFDFPGDPTSKVNLTAQQTAFKTANSAKKWEEERTEASLPVDMSRVINTAKFIPAILENEINSELPGKVVATIEENIYGSHGRLVLIPGGSKAVGRYRPLGKMGEKRLAIIWERIITYPDGIDIPIMDAEMTDGMGRSGITGDLDNRFLDRYGMALFVSALGALAQTQIPVDNRASGLAIESIGNTSAGMAKTILDKNLELKPILTVPQGTRITISTQRDVWFRPAADGKLQAVAVKNNNRR